MKQGTFYSLKKSHMRHASMLHSVKEGLEGITIHISFYNFERNMEGNYKPQIRAMRIYIRHTT